MNMKKSYFYILLLMALMVVSACSDSEDTTPSYADTNSFAPSADDQSAEAQLRRKFFEETGSYIIFNDTLSKEQTGVDAYGKPVYKENLLNLGFDMQGSSSIYRYTYDYLANMESKQKAVELVKQKLMSKLGDLKPFSILLVDGIYCWSKENGEWVPSDSYYADPNPTYSLGSRCYAFSMNGGEAFEDDAYFKNILVAIVIDKINAKGSTVLAEFEGLVENYDDLVAHWDSKEDMGYEPKYDLGQAHRVGFLSDWNRYYFPDKKIDRKDYINAVFSMSVEEFEAEYADYPVCIARYRVMRNLILSLGVNLD